MAELVAEGNTGFLVADVAEAARAISRVGELDRGECRLVAEARFGHETMARGYLGAYGRALQQANH
jgi:glycosyltransferase involved in cell wall biosynthesis